MGISLNGLTPAGTYPGLIKTGDNTAISGTPKVLSDGNGNNLPMEVSTTGVNFTNQLQQGGVAVPTASQVAAKQDTLVSGTNIKTINGTSLLGSGNIPVVTSPSGVSGAIQFSNGSAFASDASNLFWDDTNNRLGIGTNVPSTKMQIITDDATSPFAYSSQITQLAGSSLQGLSVAYSATNGAYINSLFPGTSFSNLTYTAQDHRFSTAGTVSLLLSATGNATFSNNTTSLGAKVGIKGSGSTSATTSLLVQNSAGTEALKVRDDSTTVCYSLSMLGEINTRVLSTNLDIYGQANGTAGFGTQIWGFTGSSWQETLKVVNNTNPSVIIGSATYDASAKLKVDSTVSGFLPPRMTTTQKNAIASPAAGLVVYDSTTNKLCCYNGSTWNDLF
jgi:hypothetical protein